MQALKFDAQLLLILNSPSFVQKEVVFNINENDFIAYEVFVKFVSSL